MQVPPWEALAEGLRSEDVDVEPEPSQPNHGWQKFASTTVQHVHGESVVWPPSPEQKEAMVRSQSGPLVSVPFTAMPTSSVTRIGPEPIRVLLLRRLRSPLPLVLAPAAVAVSMTSLATTGQHAAQEGRWEEGGSRPKMQWRRSAGRSQGVSQCNVAGPGHRPTADRWTPVGGCRGRIDPCLGVSVGIRRHSGFTFAR